MKKNLQSLYIEKSSVFSVFCFLLLSPKDEHADVAQLVEREYRKLQVAGSTPVIGSIQ
jgi:hypothetical protein